MKRQNTIASSPLIDVYSRMLADYILEKRTPTFARDILPKIAVNSDMDVALKHLVYVKYTFDGKADISDLRQKTLPVINEGAESHTVNLRWLSVGIETDPNKEDDIRTGKVKPVNAIQRAFKIITETEDSFLLDGFTALSAKGLNDDKLAGIHLVTAGKTWATSTGEEIVEDIRKMHVAMVTGMKYTARTLALPQEFDLLLDKIYTNKAGQAIDSAKTTREVLMGKNFYQNHKVVLGITAPMLLDDISENFGFVEILPVTVGEEYSEGRNKISPVEEKISEFILINPESIVRLSGAK